MRVFRVLLSAIFLLVSFGAPPVNAQISLANIGFYPSVKTGSQYQIELGLISPKNIRISTYLKGPKDERIQGSTKLNSGTLRNGKWILTFNIPSTARTGKYRINIRAIAGKFNLVDQARTVDVIQNDVVNNQNGSSEVVDLGYDAASGNHLESHPTFVYGLKKSCGGALGKCPSLTDESELQSQSLCKIPDATYPNDSNLYLSSAFTTPPYSLAGKSDITLNWFPVSFKDRPFPDTLYKLALKTATEAEGFYEFNSYGRVNFTFTVPEKNLWINLPEELSFYEKLWASMTTQQVSQYLLDKAGPNGAPISDAIMFIFPEGKYSITKNSFYDRDLKLKLQNSFISSSRVYGIHDHIESIGVNGFTHGLGHALYSFEDLYISAGSSASGVSEQPGNGWDVMIGGGEFFVWQRWHIGWLKDSEVSCTTNLAEPKTFYLEPFQSHKGKKLIVIKLNSSKVILAEYRTNTAKSILKQYNLCQKGGVSQCESKYPHSGLLVYDLDTNRGHAAGPFRVSKESKEKLVGVGQSLSYEGHKFEVLAADESGIFVRVETY